MAVRSHCNHVVIYRWRVQHGTLSPSRWRGCGWQGRTCQAVMSCGLVTCFTPCVSRCPGTSPQNQEQLRETHATSDGDTGSSTSSSTSTSSAQAARRWRSRAVGARAEPGCSAAEPGHGNAGTAAAVRCKDNYKILQRTEWVQMDGDCHCCRGMACAITWHQCTWPPAAILLRCGGQMAAWCLQAATAEPSQAAMLEACTMHPHTPARYTGLAFKLSDAPR
jgi:hypothetical protein